MNGLLRIRLALSYFLALGGGCARNPANDEHRLLVEASSQHSSRTPMRDSRIKSKIHITGYYWSPTVGVAVHHTHRCRDTFRSSIANTPLLTAIIRRREEESEETLCCHQSRKHSQYVPSKDECMLTFERQHVNKAEQSCRPLLSSLDRNAA
jgi:hypothetical protein